MLLLIITVADNLHRATGSGFGQSRPSASKHIVLRVSFLNFMNFNKVDAANPKPIYVQIIKVDGHPKMKLNSRRVKCVSARRAFYICNQKKKNKK